MFNPLDFISKFIKSGNQVELDRIAKIVENINALEDDFKNLVKRLQEYKDGKFDVIEKISNTVRTLDVV